MNSLAKRLGLCALSCFVVVSVVGCGSERLSSILVIPAQGATVLSATGQTVQFKAIASYTSKHSNTQDVTDQVTWSTSQSAVATIGSGGLATAGTTAGTTVITASLKATNGVVTGTSDIVVSSAGSGGGGAAALTAIALIPATQTVPVNQAGQFIAIGTLSNGATVDLTSRASWTSSNTKVATVASGRTSGLATAMSNGLSTITAIFNNPDGSVVTGSGGLTVVGGGEPVQSLAITPGSQTVSVNQTGQYIAIATMGTGASENLTSQVTWSSSNEAVATVNSTGLATALSSGTTSITAIETNPDNSIATGLAALSVTAAVGGAGGGTPTLLSISILPGSQAVGTVNETGQFIAIGTFSAAPVTQDVTSLVKWSSSDVKVATIDSSGLATGLNTGSTAILAKYTNPDKSLVTGSAAFSEGVGGSGTQLATLTIVPVGPNAATGDVSGYLSDASGVANGPEVIHCGPDFSSAGSVCVGNFVLGSWVKLTATAGTGSTFFGYSINTYASPTSLLPCTTTVCYVLLNDNDTVGAIFNSSTPQ